MVLCYFFGLPFEYRAPVYVKTDKTDFYVDNTINLLLEVLNKDGKIRQIKARYDRQTDIDNNLKITHYV